MPLEPIVLHITPEQRCAAMRGCPNMARYARAYISESHELSVYPVCADCAAKYEPQGELHAAYQKEA